MSLLTREALRSLPALGCGVLISVAAFCAAAAEFDCERDIRFAADFLRANDAGMIDLHQGRLTPAMEAALDAALIAGRGAADGPDCSKALLPFLRSIRRGHLAVRATTVAVAPGDALTTADRPPLLEFRRPSDRTVYLAVRTFDIKLRDLLDQTLREETESIRRADQVILDVRENNGGYDHTFRPLIEMLGPWRYRNYGDEVWSSAENIEGWRAILQTLPSSAKDVRAVVRRVIALMERRPGKWVLVDRRRIETDVVTSAPGRPVARRVWLLIDRPCGSSCEAFVLQASQNPRVTIAGRNTFGALDYSNLRWRTLPSGSVTIYYATTRTTRPHSNRVDTTGLAPRVPLPAPQDADERWQEVLSVQHLAENGLDTGAVWFHRK